MGKCSGNTDTALGLYVSSTPPGTFQFPCPVGSTLKANPSTITGGTSDLCCDLIQCPTENPNAQGETPTNLFKEDTTIQTGTKDKCTCGTATCEYRHNYGSYDRICNAGSNTCSTWPTCSNTDNSVMLVTPDVSTLGTNFPFATQRPQCKCGTRYCRQGDELGQSNNDGTPAGPAHMYCNAVTSECSLKACDNTDGTVLNAERCQCGIDHCMIHSSAKPRATNGYYCNAANNMCGITKEINRFSATVPREPLARNSGYGRPEAANFFTRCSDVSGNVVVMNEIECFEAAAAKGVEFQAVTGSAYPSGCFWGGHGAGGSEYSVNNNNQHEGTNNPITFNTAPKKFGADETMFTMICKSGTVCQNTDGSATNIDACVCGSVECFPGSTCEGSKSLCTLVNQAEKIAEIETNQKTCCSKNAALEAEIALLKKQYEGIDEMCKAKATDSDERRLATAAVGCGGGASMSNANTTPDGLSPGEIAAIIIVPIIVLLGCVGGCIMYKQQQKSKTEKTPENLYELKNFTQQRVTAELFDVRGSMNSNNPLADETRESEAGESERSSTPTMPELSIEMDDSSHTFSGSNPMSRNLQQNESNVVVLDLPLNWEEVSGTDGAANYFWNNVTNVTQYERPLH